MDAFGIAIRVLTITAIFTAVIWTFVALVGRARKPSKSFRAIGAALMLFGWGNLRDPRNDTVAEAQDGRIRGSAESGDPPSRD